MGGEDRHGVRASGPFSCPPRPGNRISESGLSSLESGGREGIRTPGLLVANEALSQLSYSPTSSSKSILAKEKWVANTRQAHRFQRRNPSRYSILHKSRRGLLGLGAPCFYK